MKNNKQGFTIIEVIVVIVIIAILATIALVTYSSIQADTRDSERDSKTKLISNALEKYYEENGEYPSCSAMTQPGSQVATNLLDKLDPENLLTPNSSPSATNSITCSDLSSGGGSTDVYGYVGDGSTACNTGNACMQYTLQYREEGSGNIVSIESQHKTQLGIGGSVTLTAVRVSNTQINLSWPADANATSYSIQRATDPDFSNNLVETSATGTTSSATGLTPGTTYYFQVRPNSQVNPGDWSNTANATTSISAPPTPTTSAGISGGTAIGTANTVTCAAGTPQYQLRYRAQATTTLGAWSGWSRWSSTERTYSVGAAQGYRYDFQSHARCQGADIVSSTTADSGVASTVMPISTPGAPTYLNPPFFRNLWNYWVDYASYCPGGTWMVNGNFNSRAWTGGQWGPYAFHYWDSWQNAESGTRNVEYWARYQCASSYTTSPVSYQSYNVIQVYNY